LLIAVVGRGSMGKEEDQSSAPVLFTLLEEEREEAQEALAEQLTAAVSALREECSIELGLVRDEILGRIDALQFGRTLDVDPDVFQRAVAELRKDLDRRSEVVNARFDALGGEIEQLAVGRRKLAVKLSEIEHRLRGLPAPPLTITDWRVDAESYTAVPVMSDGSTGAPLPLRGLFQQYYDDAKT
jgi:hypothetical protein